jgi:NADP-dependent 3-hydroxy acid dehydrogenase YdfG
MDGLETIDVSGKNIVITGGTTGIGRATARLLAARGAHVLICGRHQQEMEDALKDIRGDARGVLTDLSTQAGVETLFAEVDKAFGTLHIVVSNAALAADPLGEMKPDDIEYVVRTNLLGYLLVSREALKRFKKQKEGHLVLVGSMSADVRAEGESVYAATKTGIQGFAEALRKEVNKLGVRVSLIQPGAVGTDMQPKKQTHEQQTAEMTMLKAEDIAACVYYIVTQPLRCDVVVLDIRPHLQAI